MFLNLDPDNGLAIYDQIVRQIKFAVADGAMKPGEFAPSVRELARELAVNPNTVARAYRQLQSDRVLEPVRGAGLEVAAGAVERCRQARLKLLRQRIKQVLVEARQSKIDLHELRSMVEAELAELEQKGKSA